MSSTPGLHNVHFNQMLTNFVRANIQDDTVFGARKLFQAVSVPFKSGNYYSVPEAPFLTTQTAPLAPGAETMGKDFDLNQDNTYDCKVYGLHHDLPDQVAANCDGMINLTEMISKLLSHDALLQQELAWKNTYYRRNLWTGFSYNGVVQDFDMSNMAYSTGQWDVAPSDPIATIDYVLAQTGSVLGAKFNKAVMPLRIFNVFKNHPLVIQRYRSGPAGQSLVNGQLNQQQLASLMGLDELIVPLSIANAAEEGQTPAQGYLFNNDMLLCYAPSSPSIMNTGAGATFLWSNYANGMELKTDSLRIETHFKTRYRVTSSYDMKLVEPRLGVMLTNILSK